MLRTRSIVFVTFLCLLLPTLAAAQAPAPRAQQAALSLESEIHEFDWEASRNLVFVAAENLAPGPHEVQVRIEESGTPLFFERLTFRVLEEKSLSVASSEAVRTVQLMAYNPTERAWLLERVRSGAEVRVELRLDGDLFSEGTLADLMAASDALREGKTLPYDSETRLADLRDPLGGGVQKNLCVDDCYDDYSECQVDFCYWDYDEFMCNEGCDLELDDCLAVADPVCAPPTCTPGVISTSTSSQLISLQVSGTQCFRDFFPPPPGNPFAGVLYQSALLTYQVTTTERRRNADCSITTVVTGVSTATSFCHRNLGFPCSFGFGFPSCFF
ncbi:MAG: hypothetical protein AAF725_03085 [Acidobacteriota bacterium]